MMRFHGAVQFVLSSHMRLEGFWQIFVVAVIAWCCDGLPTTMDRFKRSPVYDNVQNYLVQYGYLPQAASSLVAGNLRTEDQLKDAIRSLQTFGNIPVTGELDAETMRLLTSPRCGLPDVQSADNVRRKRYALQGQKWPHKNLTWSLQPNDKVQNLDYYKVLEVLEKAFNIWSKHSQLTFKSLYSSNADILIYFDRQQHGDGFPFDGLGGVLAHAFFPGSGRGGDVHFDSDEIWQLEETADNSKGTSLIGVAAHEFGHSLGLSHSSVSGSLMSPWYQGWKDNFQLPEDDRYAIQSIYGANIDTSTTQRSPPTYRPPYTRYTTRYTPPQPPSTRPPQVPRTKPPNPESIPDKCDTSYDAITMIRGELFIFKDKYMWRISEKGLHNDFPNLITRMWRQLPEDFTHVDAVYEKNDHKHIVFLIGRRIYMFHGTELLPGYPKPLVEWGFPATLDHIDAAMVWGYNSKTYFFSGYQYWRFDDEIDKVDLDYPRNMSIWKGIGTNIDAAFQWKNGVTYFFKGKGYWKFNDIKLSVSNKHQSPSAQFWMGCPKSLQNPNDIESSSQESIIPVYDLKPNEFFASYQYAILIVSIIIAVILVISIVVIIRRRNSHSYIRPKRIKR